MFNFFNFKYLRCFNNDNTNSYSFFEEKNKTYLPNIRKNPNDEIEKIKATKWWDWSDEKIQEKALCFNDVEEYIKMMEREI